MPPPQAMGVAAVDVMQQAAAKQRAIAQAVATIQQAGSMGGGAEGDAFVTSIRALEGTLHRLDESFHFAVECMQTDLAQAKAQLAELKAQV